MRSFFVDCPTQTERAAIVKAALRQHGRTEPIDCDAVANATMDFVGAELAALIPDSMFAAFADNARPITTDDLLMAARSTVPLARTAADKINIVREWAKGRARPASIPDSATVGASRTIDI